MSRTATATSPSSTSRKIKESTNSRREVYYTPESALKVIQPVLKNFKTIWDPAAGAESYPVKDFFEKNGTHKVIISDIIEGKEFDFLTYKTKKRYEVIVTTPPYSYRKEFITRACELKKPFALLVPVNVLESKTVREHCKKYNLSLIFPEKTTNFISPSDSKSVKTLPYSVWIVGGIEKVPPVVFT